MDHIYVPQGCYRMSGPYGTTEMRGSAREATVTEECPLCGEEVKKGALSNHLAECEER